jgi:hypothetical protein
MKSSDIRLFTLYIIVGLTVVAHVAVAQEGLREGENFAEVTNAASRALLFEWSNCQYGDGDGLTPETAVNISGAATQTSVFGAVFTWIARHISGSCRQSWLGYAEISGSKALLKQEIFAGDKRKVFYFSVTNFFLLPSRGLWEFVAETDERWMNVLSFDYDAEWTAYDAVGIDADRPWSDVLTGRSGFLVYQDELYANTFGGNLITAKQAEGRIEGVLECGLIKDGQKDGPWVFRAFSSTITDGRRDRQPVSMSSQDIVWRVMHYRKGIVHGANTGWREDGTVAFRLIYSNDLMVAWDKLDE